MSVLWPHVPLWAVSADAQTGPFGSQLHSDEYVENEIPLINPSNIVNGNLFPDRAVTVGESTAQRLSRHRLEPGDLIFARRGELGRAAVVNEDAVGWLCGTGSLRVRLRPGAFNSDFIGYVLQSAATRSYFELVAVGTTMDNLNTAIVNSLPVPRPPMQNQEQIAAFLDAETARIDALISKRRRLGEVLAERFHSLIDNSVEEGKATTVRRVTSLITSGPRGWSDRAGDEGIPFIRSANLQRDSLSLRSENLQRVIEVTTAEGSRSKARVGDTVVGITGANTGWVGLVGRVHAPGYVSQHVALLRPNGSLRPGWLTFCLYSRRVQGQLAAGQYGGTKQQLGLEDLAEVSIFVPSFDRQRELVERIRIAEKRQIHLAGLLARQISLLQERRRALITAAVTGELQIPERVTS